MEHRPSRPVDVDRGFFMFMVLAARAWWGVNILHGFAEVGDCFICGLRILGIFSLMCHVFGTSAWQILGNKKADDAESGQWFFLFKGTCPAWAPTTKGFCFQLWPWLGAQIFQKNFQRYYLLQPKVHAQPWRAMKSLSDMVTTNKHLKAHEKTAKPY